MNTTSRRWSVSPLQVFLLTVALIDGTAIVTLPAPLVRFAGPSAWVAALVGLPAGLLPLGILYLLDRRAPDRTIVEHARLAAGPVGGALLTLPILALFLNTLGNTPREFTDLVAGVALPRTPTVVVTALLLAAPVAVVRAGLEVLARLAELLILPGLLALAGVLAANVRDMQPINLLPVLARGWGPVLQAAAAPAGWYMEMLYLTAILPFGQQRRGAHWRAALLGLLCAGVLLSCATAATQAVFGPATAALAAPVFQLARVADVSGFLTHLEPFLMVAWVTLGYVKTGIFFYVFCIGLAQTLGLSHHRALTLPVAAMAILVNTVWYDSAADVAYFVTRIWPFVACTAAVVAPLLVLAATWLKGITARPTPGGNAG